MQHTLTWPPLAGPFDEYCASTASSRGLVWVPSERKAIRPRGCQAVPAVLVLHKELNLVTTDANDRQIDYIELPAADVDKSKAFYARVFGWKFTDYGPDYTTFEDGRLAGGFWKKGDQNGGGPLVVIYAVDLAGMEAQVRAAGGTIVKETFPFPGGRRFHFTDPSGNELAVWSDR